MNEVNSNDSVNKYDVVDFYKKGWATVKKHLKPLMLITFVGVVGYLVIQSILIFAVVNTVFDGVDGFALSLIVTSAVGLLASIFVGLLQLVAVKKASEGKKPELGSVAKESFGYITRVLSYGLFIVAVMIGAGILLGISAFAGPFIGLLLGLAFTVLIIILLFRYAFLQFVVVEPKEAGFLERFKIAETLSNGIYGTIFITALFAILLNIGGAIVSGILTAPFNQSTGSEFSNNLQTNLEGVDENYSFSDAVNDTKEETETEFNFNYIMNGLISGLISWGLGLVIMSAFLQLYNQRKKEIKE